MRRARWASGLGRRPPPSYPHGFIKDAVDARHDVRRRHRRGGCEPRLKAIAVQVLHEAVAAGLADRLRAASRSSHYIVAHTTPEVTPFLVFALGGGSIPLPLTVPQLLALDVGTETLPGARARPRASRVDLLTGRGGSTTVSRSPGGYSQPNLPQPGPLHGQTHPPVSGNRRRPGRITDVPGV
jgi:hypothetical protein